MEKQIYTCITHVIINMYILIFKTKKMVTSVILYYGYTYIQVIDTIECVFNVGCYCLGVEYKSIERLFLVC